MSFTGFIIKKAVPVPKIESFNRYLFVGPHPDDIEVGAGATVSKLVSEGKEVCFLICTDGRFGFENAPDSITPEELIDIRKEEALKSAGMLGVNDVRFLGLSDGGFYTDEELSLGIMKTVSDFKPDIVFCPDPDVISECHTDHLNVGKAVKRIAFFAHHDRIMQENGYDGAQVQALAFYMTANFNSYVKTEGHLEKQLDALFNSHISQYPPGSGDREAINTYIKLRAAINGLKCFSSSAEGFRVLGIVHMHCLPEICE